jgi:hypothetical protein
MVVLLIYIFLSYFNIIFNKLNLIIKLDIKYEKKHIV